MLRQSLLMIGLLSFLSVSFQASALGVTVNTDAARAVLVALQNSSLSHQEAIKIAQLTGNQGIIRKENEFKIPVTTESFANALWAAAHGLKVTDVIETALFFDKLKPKAGQLLELTRQIEANPMGFEAPIEKRIALFTPPGSDIHLQGYIVAGGDGGGYAFGDTDFYLNLLFMDDLVVAGTDTTHELYHAVQGAFANERRSSFGASGQTRSQAQQSCENTAQLFADLYEEGSATYVEDISALSQSHSDVATRQLNDLSDGLAHVNNSATLLELSVVGVNATKAVPFDDVYDVGFYGHGILYNIAYVMAKAIAENDGPQGLATFLKQPPYTFLLRYTHLPKYGMDKEHPALGPNTVDEINELASGCK